MWRLLLKNSHLHIHNNFNKKETCKKNYILNLKVYSKIKKINRTITCLLITCFYAIIRMKNEKDK